VPNATEIRAKVVIAGLDPAIHPLRKNLHTKMDARVKPAHDRVERLLS